MSEPSAERVRKTLYLLRHAKSAHDDPTLDDHDRPLTPRGHRAAAAIAGYLRQQAPTVDLVLCSTATRARQTWDPIREALNGAPVIFDRAFYTFGHRALMSRLTEVEDPVSTVMVIGHNPALADLALTLCPAPRELPAGQAALRQKMATTFPTAAFAALTVDGPWSALPWRHNTAAVIAFVRPKDLLKG